MEMSLQTLKAENDFCSICLRSNAEVKLDPISTKMYEMFFVRLVKCVESKEAIRNLCVWCRRRVVNALKLVEAARATDRILTNITQTDNSHCLSNKQITWDQIQTAKRTHGLTPRNSRVISYSLLSDSGISSPVKLEREHAISSEEENVCLYNVINKDELDMMQTTKNTNIRSSKISQVTSCNLPPDSGISLPVKLKCENDISGEESEISLENAVNKGDLDQVSAEKGTNIVTSRTHRVSCKLARDTGIGSSMKLEREDDTFVEDGNICIDSVDYRDRCFSPHQNAIYCESDLNQIEAINETHIKTSITPQVISCNLLPDTVMSLSVELEHEDGITCRDSMINEGELEHKDPIAPERHNFLEIKLESEIDDGLNTELDIEEKTPCLNKARKRDTPTLNTVMKKTTKEMEFNKKVHNEVSNVELIEAVGNQNSVPEIINEKTVSEYGERLSKNGSQCDKSNVEVEKSEANSETTYSSADIFRYIRLLKLTEAQQLQELEGRRMEARFRNASFKCEPCVLTFAHLNTYELHMERHSEKFGSHKCSVCGVYFDKMNSYRRHRRNHYERYACAVCGFNCPRKQEALTHYLSQHANEYKCEHCASEFRTAPKLKQHMKTVHNVERPLFSCPHCSQVLSTKQSYKLHVTQHNQSMPRRCCGLCSEAFYTASDLRKHKMIHFLGRKFFCQQCGDGFKLRSTLHMHIKRKHSGICFECDYCQKTFSLKGDLKEHITWQHLGHGYKCQLCPKVLRAKFLLVRHIKLTHEGWTVPKDKVCEVCGKGFSRNNALKIHRRIHSRDRP